MNQPNSLALSLPYQWLFALTAFILVAFGQPASLPWNGVLAAIGGYALFWRVLLAYSSKITRFWLASVWFFGVQLIQLSWFISHPYWYIYAVYGVLAFGVALQFGLIGICIQKSTFTKLSSLIAVAALWTIFEWVRLFILSGLSWNPVGLALTNNIYSLQAAALGGVFALSFWVIFVNLLGLRAYLCESTKFFPIAGWLFAAAFPYLFGFAHIYIHDQTPQKNIQALLVQTAFPTEEAIDSTHRKNPIDEVIDEWRQILQITKKFKGNSIDLMVLPEFVVPFGTYAFAFPLHRVLESFLEILGPESLKYLPSVNFPLSAIQKTALGPQLMVNNAFWSQALANYFAADVLIGLEDAEDLAPGKREHYSAALFFHPLPEAEPFEFPARYEKQVLVPMGEYIPFSFCRDLAARYGVAGSFTHGKEAKIMSCGNILFSPSICYEETFGDLMTGGRKKGAELLVNLTSDTWYPNSSLTRQHFDHARLRTVENGVPLIRACNTGITAAVDSLGRIIAMLGNDKPEDVEWIPDALLVNVPINTYSTPYSYFGDKLIIGLCLAMIAFGLINCRKLIPSVIQNLAFPAARKSPRIKDRK